MDDLERNRTLLPSLGQGFFGFLQVGLVFETLAYDLVARVPGTGTLASNWSH